MNIFIDANVLLGFYERTPAELEELRKLVALANSGIIVLWLPEQVEDEFRRNRTKVLAEARKGLAEARIRMPLPAIVRGLAESATVEGALRETQKAHSKLLQALDATIASRQLEADLLLEELLKLAKKPETATLLDAARSRRDLRRPPGKATSLGDALNWEALLRDVPDGEDLFVVTDDPDFRSPLDENTLLEYLADEWRNRKASQAKLYRNLGALAKTHYPHIVLATDVEKLAAIQALESSSTFAETHAIVARLSRFDLFSPEQASQLIRASAHNSQVRWIAQDSDVFHLLERVITAHRDTLDPSLVAILEAEMYPSESSSEEYDVDLE